MEIVLVLAFGGQLEEYARMVKRLNNFESPQDAVFCKRGLHFIAMSRKYTCDSASKPSGIILRTLR